MKARGAGDDDDDGNDDDGGNDEVRVVIERAKGIVLIKRSMTHGIVNTRVNRRREKKNINQNVEARFLQTNLIPKENIKGIVHPNETILSSFTQPYLSYYPTICHITPV